MDPSGTKTTDSSAVSDWQRLMALFEEISELPETDRPPAIDAKNLDAKTQSKLESMLRTLNHTISLLDTPITGRVQLPPQWYADQWIGKHLNQFRLDELLHEGNIAGVFVATQLEPVKRQVAIKLIRPEASKEFREFFRSEQLTLAKLSHPNIASIHTVEVCDDGLSFSVMEYIKGSTLSKYCDDNQLNIPERLALFLDICDAVSYAHQRGVLHRDLKSSNILVRGFEDKPIPTLIDFDIASDLNNRIDRPDEYLMGTPEYMSPEHVLDQNDMDVRADVYSLGMVFFTLLVGAIPFDRSRLADMSQAQRLSLIAEFETLKPSEHFKALSLKDKEHIANSRGATLREFESQLTAGMDYVFLQATHKQREMRYQSVADLVVDVKNLLAKRPVTAHPRSMLYVVRKFVQRHAIPTALVASIVVLGLGFMTKVAMQSDQIQAESERAEQEQVNAEQAAEMIIDALSIADPETANSIGRESVAELVDKTFERFRVSKGASPEFRARVLIKLADSFRHVARRDRAQEVEAIIADEIATYTLQDQAKAWKTLAMGAHNDGEFEAMVTYAREVERFSIDTEITPKSYIDALVLKAKGLEALSELEEASTALKQSLELYELSALDDLPLKARINASSAELAASQRRYHDAEDHFAEAIRLYTDVYGETDRRVVHTRFSEFNFLISIDHPRATSDLAEAITGDAIRIWGAESYAESLMLYHWATTLINEGKLDDAETRLVRLLEVLKRQNLNRDQLYVASLALLSGVYIETDRSQKAVEASTESYTLVTGSNEGAPDHLPVIIAQIEKEHAKALLANSQYEEALNVIESSIEFFFSTESQYFPEALLIRAFIYTLTDDLKNADQDVQTALTFLMLSPAETSVAEKETLLTAQLMEHYLEYLNTASDNAVAAIKQASDEHSAHRGGKALPYPYSMISQTIK